MILPRRHLLATAGAALSTGLAPRRGLAAPSGPQSTAQILADLAAPYASMPPLPPVAEEDALLAMGYVGPTSDGGWTEMHHVALQAVRREFPRLRTVYVESVPYSADATRLLREFVAEGAQMVMTGADYGDFLTDVAARAPDTAFVQCDGRAVKRNVSWYYIAHWYVSYVIGVAAGLLSKTGKLGFIGAFPLPSAYAGANAALMGARTVNPDATMQVITINAWFDPQAAIQAANALADKGCDFLFGIMDEAGYLHVAQERGLWAAMWNKDIRQFGPDAYVASVVLDFAQFYIAQVRARLAGTWRPVPQLLMMGQGVDRDPWGRRVPQDVRDKADAVRSRIMNGWSPFVGPLRDQHGTLRLAQGEVMNDLELYHWNWAVDGVSGLP
ncbi:MULTISPECIES: BMP family ABC transporter substrate-binding protein [Komagataeibacter]|uniref:Purine-binding protein n=2 Tax=Komagataeibacter saccharivorans TaxID=265959 RepID=A0A347WF51_9PROT|nr:BMP family ABC transporter substrate-binding protein [Komagataeibacter saccharivorans]AXY23494.1 Purine-binding protein precursor [Komagataeibacter saccharivorans]MBL7235689.1 BMP family ABC transporter substrate-binding protein [Novacetimonas hansenii]PYD50182.1 BMP family ABC transporter substrate-binding protein [Komagataeibacter saccharivorans]GBQ41066.1 basic membrane lipoprotein [Komagataeibacter saccharivorans NRIC 0614]